jgi:hypothetical protein
MKPGSFTVLFFSLCMMFMLGFSWTATNVYMLIEGLNFNFVFGNDISTVILLMGLYFTILTAGALIKLLGRDK